MSSQQIAEYTYGEAYMPEPWGEQCLQFATDVDTRERFVSIDVICEIVGLNVDTQTRSLKRAAAATVDTNEGETRFVLDPGALRKIVMPPRAGAALRAGLREHGCIRHDAIGWWLAHIPPHKIADVRVRSHIEAFQAAVQAAADKLFWRLGSARALPAPATHAYLSTATCHHDGKCPCCAQWIRVTTHNGETQWERLA